MAIKSKQRILLLADINSIHTQKWVVGLKDDFEVAVCSLDKMNEALSKVYQGVEVIDSNEKMTSGNKMRYFSQLKRFKTFARNWKPDIVHAHYATSYGMLARMMKPKQLFISVWGSDVYAFPKKSFLHKSIMKWILKGANRIFSTSNDMANVTSELTKGNIEVIPFGVDCELFKPVENHSRTNIGTVKGLKLVYGIDRLIKAVKKVNEKIIITCDIYGKGDHEEQFKALAKELKIEDRVNFKGFVDNELVPSVINNFKIFYALSRQESFGVAVVEAQACGVPVIVWNTGGLPEVVKDKETGYVVNSIEEAVECTLMLLQDEDLIREMGVAARNHILDNYDWNKNLQSMKKAYKNLNE